MLKLIHHLRILYLTQKIFLLAGIVAYTDCPSTAEYPPQCFGYNTKLSEGEAPVLELRGMWNTPSLPSLPGPL